MASKNNTPGKTWEGMFWEPHKYNERIKLKSGTYLQTFCPHCGQELNHDQVLRLEVVNFSGEDGIVELCPYLDTFQRQTTIRLPEGKEVKDLRCPLCHQSLLLPDINCGACGAPAAGFLIRVSTAKVPFVLCTRVGCNWHAIANDDENKIILDDSDEW